MIYYNLWSKLIINCSITILHNFVEIHIGNAIYFNVLKCLRIVLLFSNSSSFELFLLCFGFSVCSWPGQWRIFLECAKSWP